MSKNISWYEACSLAEEYCKENNCTRIPLNVKYKDYNLGKWFSHQVNYYNKGVLSAEKISIMKNNGLELDSPIEKDWWNHYSLLIEFYKTHPDKLIQRKDVFKGWNIGHWSTVQKMYRKKGKLNQNQINALDKAGFLWWETKEDIEWLKIYEIVKDFFNNTYVNYVPKDVVWNNVNIYEWCHYQNRRYREKRLEDWKIKLLEEINYSFKSPKSIHSSKEEAAIFFYLKQIFPSIKNRDCSNGFEIDLYFEYENKKIGVEYDGSYFHKDKYDKDYKKIKNCENNKIILFDIRHESSGSLSQNTEFYHEYLLEDDNNDEYKSEQFTVTLKNLIVDICSLFNINYNIDINIPRDSQEITKEHIKFFDSKWINTYLYIKDFYIKYGKIPYNDGKNQKYRKWLNNQRHRYIMGQMPQNEIQLLEELYPYGFYWTIEDQWNRFYNLFVEYSKEFNIYEVRQDFIYKGFKLGKWVSKQRKAFKDNNLSQERIDKLNAVNFVWKSSYKGYVNINEYNQLTDIIE